MQLSGLCYLLVAIRNHWSNAVADLPFTLELLISMSG